MNFASLIPSATKTVGAFLLLTTPSLVAPPAQAQSNLGIVDFQTSCTPDAQSAFNEGLGLLHHMMYFQADKVFTEAGEQTPDCAMLHWGTAMSKFHPLWPGSPDATKVAAGQAAVDRMNAADPGSAMEQAFATAVSAFYEGEDVAYPERRAAWAAAQSKVFESFPENADATAFRALALLASAPRDDKTFANQRNAGALMEALNERTKLHPGAYHYAIHAYDNPALYEKGLPFAQEYGEIAPDVAHALHMPTHVFVRAGLWDQVIDWNMRSAKSAMAHPFGDLLSGHYAHAMDYMIYGHLQLGEYDRAETLLAEFVGHPNHQPNFGAAYGLAASSVRVALEQDQWRRLAEMDGTLHAAIPWEKFPQAVSIRWFAIGLGAARSGNVERAQEALNALAELRQDLEAAKSEYWLKLTDAQILTVEAWSEKALGNDALAISLQTKAADIEDAAGKSPVTPGHVLPARELLGDLLTELGNVEDAKIAYQNTLELAPNRSRSTLALN